MSRANPFSDLDDFATPPAPRPVESEAIDRLAEASGFPSRKAQGKGAGVAVEEARQAIEKGDPGPEQTRSPTDGARAPRAPRRHTTGRNRQINIKATEETIETLYRIADDLGLPLGAVLEQALAALATSLKP